MVELLASRGGDPIPRAVAIPFVAVVAVIFFYLVVKKFRGR